MSFKKFIQKKENIIITILASIILYPPANNLWQSVFLSDDQIILDYKVSFNSNLSKDDLINAIQKEFGSTIIDFSFDDELIEKYQLSVVEIENNDRSVTKSLFIDIDFQDKRVKILDVLGIKTEPRKNILDLGIKKPPLKYSPSFFSEDTMKFEVYWNVDEIQAGVIVYRSFNNKNGWGRRNSTLCQIGRFEDKSLKYNQYYYSISNLGYSGLESEFTDPVPFPEMFFNEPSFENTKTISTMYDNDTLTIENVISNFDKLIKDLTDDQNIYINLNRNEFTRWIKIENKYKSRIFFKNDFPFLEGKERIELSEFLVDSKIKLLIISKSYVDDYQNNINLSIRESGNIKLNCIKKEKLKTLNRNINPKISLTPFKTNLISHNNLAILSWSEPDNNRYKNVRVFKYKYSPDSLGFRWGDEIYRGKGKKQLILGKSTSSNSESNSLGHLKLTTSNKWDIPPEKNKNDSLNIKLVDETKSKGDKIKRPDIPTGTFIRIVYPLSAINIFQNKIMPYIIDTDVVENQEYVYVLVAEDDFGSLSYPIESIIKIEPKNKEFTVRLFEEYQNDVSALKILIDEYKNLGDYEQVRKFQNKIEHLSDSLEN